MGLEEADRFEGEEEEGNEGQRGGRVLAEEVEGGGGGCGKSGHDAGLLVNGLDEGGAAAGTDGLPELKLAGEVAGGGEPSKVGRGLLKAYVRREHGLGARLAERPVGHRRVQKQEGQVGISVCVRVRVVDLLLV